MLISGFDCWLLVDQFLCERFARDKGALVVEFTS